MFVLVDDVTRVAYFDHGDLMAVLMKDLDHSTHSFDLLGGRWFEPRDPFRGPPVVAFRCGSVETRRLVQVVPKPAQQPAEFVLQMLWKCATVTEFVRRVEDAVLGTGIWVNTWQDKSNEHDPASGTADSRLPPIVGSHSWDSAKKAAFGVAGALIRSPGEGG